MEVKPYSDPARFRFHVDDLLLRNEARNCLFLGITGTLIDRPDVYDQFHLWSINEGGDPVAAAVMTPPRNLLLADNTSEEALAALAEFLIENQFELPGVQGNRPSVDQSCLLWTESHDLRVDLEVEMGIHALREVEEVPAVPGAPRKATLDNLDLVVDWTTTFLTEADPLSSISGVERAVEKRLGVDPALGGIWLWEVEVEPVALAGYGGQLPTASESVRSTHLSLQDDGAMPLHSWQPNPPGSSNKAAGSASCSPTWRTQHRTRSIARSDMRRRGMRGDMVSDR